MKKLVLLFILLISLPVFGQGNDAQLAAAYYSRGEYAKALVYSEKVYDKDPSKANFLRLYDCYVQTDETNDAEKLLKKQVKKYRYDFEYTVMLGEFYEKNDQEAKATKVYEELIEKLPNNASSVINVYNAFRAKGKNNFALKTLEKGQKLLKNTYPLQLQFADLYGSTGQKEKMMDSYIDLLDKYPSYLKYVQNILSRQLDFTQEEDDKEYEYMKSALLEKVQKEPDSRTFNNMLVWLFVQKGSFDAALQQVQALDRRESGQGERVYELGKICIENKEYKVARKAFKYVRDLGTETRLFYPSEMALLNTRYIEVTTNRDYGKTELQEAVNEYESTLTRLGKKATVVPLILEVSHIEAYFKDDAPSAIKRLNEALTIPRTSNMQRAQIKMALADINVLNADIWEASILYMQIDKDFKFEPIGQEAKFKNARIFYYDGEFNFAQSQLDVLKQSTTKLIANDAMDLSLLITENFGLDSNYEAMYWFAQGDLLVEQHKYDSAFVLFDSIQTKYNYHSLGDDILLKKSAAMQLQGKWKEAVQYLDELLKYYQYDILADDAVFQLGDIYENHLFDSEKAAANYKKILFEYKGSMHTIEARKRFRKLRGDAVPEDEL